MEQNEKIDATLRTYLRPQYEPLAVKMIKPDDEIPQDARQPLKDDGVALTLCQALALGRREGLTILLDKESQACPIALAGLGFVKPEAYLSGQYTLAPVNQSAAARQKIAAGMPRFAFGTYTGVLIAPLAKAAFIPDVILFYGTGAQVMRLIQGAVFDSGEALTSKSVGSGGCLLPIVVPMLEGRCTYAIPGNGERRLGMVADGEFAFAMPRKLFETVVSGLELSHAGKQGYPISSGYLKTAYGLPPPYVKLRQAMLDDSK